MAAPQGVDAAAAALQRIAEHVQTSMQAHSTEKMPFVTLTYAQSIDGSIAAVRGVPTLLSGPASMKMTHTLRTLHDAILVGIGTVLADNPSLNARFAEGRNPRPVIVDTTLRCPLDIKLFTSSSCEKPVILCADTSADPELQRRREALEHAGATIIECTTTVDADGAAHVDIRRGIELLHTRLGLRSVMIEGGAAVLTACLQEAARAHFIDSVIVTIAPVFIGGLRALDAPVLQTAADPTIITGPTSSSTSSSASAQFPRLHHVSFHALGSDLVLLGGFESAIPK